MIAVIEKQSEEHLAAPGFDGRDIALTHLSIRILKELGISAHFEPDERAPIMEARVPDGKSPYYLTFDREKNLLDTLGYIVSNHDIRRALYDAMKSEHLATWRYVPA